MNQIILLASMLISIISGHVVLDNPKPFKFVADGPTNPISTTGDDFPCKIPAGASYEIDGSPTIIAIGETFEATFKGQAVHGGGSCQFALSDDMKPTKDSKWMVIHSIEGGCPARNQKGNLEGPNEDKFPFQIPASITPGDYVFAWIWLARVGGQPEYYMNCAPITVTGIKKKREHFADRRTTITKREQFPELFMANIGELSGGCTTGEALNAQIPIAFPNPGIYVDHLEGTQNLYKQPCDGNPRAGSPAELPDGHETPASSIRTASPSSAATYSTVVSTASSVVASSAISSSALSGIHSILTTISVDPTVPSKTIKTGESTLSTTAPTEPTVPTSTCPAPIVTTVTTEVTITITATVVATSVPAHATVVNPTFAPTSSPSVSEPAPSACTEGYLTCLPDETNFATCTGGKLTSPQPIAPGFKCAAGEGQGLDISPVVPYW
ncbi:endoglucanase [Colletotrichum tofieldiae]|nr:endoglucanase [Colletotrichum tofieldiae]GKT72628.1 endoglucanase [Colletotrichum tofieldiae]